MTPDDAVQRYTLPAPDSAVDLVHRSDGAEHRFRLALAQADRDLLRRRLGALKRVTCPECQARFEVLLWPAGE